MPLSQVPAISTDTRHIQALAALGVQRRYRRGTLLIQEGDTGDTLYIVLQGRLRAYLSGDNGKELTLGNYGPLEYVGEMSLDGGPRSANVEAIEASTCSVVSRATLLAYIAEHPEFALELMSRLIRRARLATESARSVALIDVYGRLARLLNQLAATPNAQGERPLLSAARIRRCRSTWPVRARWSAVCSRIWKRAAMSRCETAGSGCSSRCPHAGSGVAAKDQGEKKPTRRSVLMRASGRGPEQLTSGVR